MSVFDDLFENDFIEVDGVRVHSRFAPSALKRILACPRSVALGEVVLAAGRTKRGSIWAAEGSVAHLVAEAWLVGEDPHRVLDVGTVIEHEGYKVTIDEEMHRHGRDYAAYVRGLMVPGDQLFVENTVRLDAIVGEEAQMFGHLDAAIWSPARRLLIIIDYKYGKGIRVSALDNPQLKAYALGAMYSIAEIMPDDVQKIGMHVFQPRVKGTPRPDEMYALDLLQWGHEEVAPLTSLILKDGAIQTPYVTGDHCRFCPAASQCPASRDRALKAAQRQFAEAPVPPSAYTDDEIAEALGEVDVISFWIEAVQEEGLGRALAGRTIKDRKVVEASKRVWEDEKATVAALENDFGLRAPAIYTEPALKSVPQVEKLIPKDRFAEFNGLWTNKPGKRSLVHVSDKRPPIRVRSAAEIFANASLPEEQ